MMEVLSRTNALAAFKAAKVVEKKSFQDKKGEDNLILFLDGKEVFCPKKHIQNVLLGKVSNLDLVQVRDEEYGEFYSLYSAESRETMTCAWS
jgi:hypothetical protein